MYMIFQYYFYLISEHTDFILLIRVGDDCLKLQETSTFFDETTEAMEQSSTDVS